MSAIVGVSALQDLLPGERVRVTSKRKGGMFGAHVHDRVGTVVTPAQAAQWSSTGVDKKLVWLDKFGPSVRNATDAVGITTPKTKQWVLLDAIDSLPRALVLKSDGNLLKSDGNLMLSCAELMKTNSLFSSRDTALQFGDEEQVQYWTKKIALKTAITRLYPASDERCDQFLQFSSSLITRNDFSIFENELRKTIEYESTPKARLFWFETYNPRMRLPTIDQLQSDQLLGEIAFAHDVEPRKVVIDVSTDDLKFREHGVQVVKRGGHVLPPQNDWKRVHYESTAEYFIQQLLDLDNKHFQRDSTTYEYQFDMHFQHRNSGLHYAVKPLSLFHVDYGPVYGKKPWQSSDRWDVYHKPRDHLANFGLWIPTTEEPMTGHYLTFLLPNSGTRAEHSVVLHYKKHEPEVAMVSAAAMLNSSVYGKALKNDEAYFFSHGEYVDTDGAKQQWKPGVPHGALNTGKGSRSSVEVRGVLSRSAAANKSNNIIHGRIYYFGNKDFWIYYEAEINESNEIIKMTYTDNPGLSFDDAMTFD